MLAPGTRLGPYEVLAPLGAGGMGEVYQARDTRLDREVAVKVLPEELFSDPDVVARFSREARALAALNHPGIASVHSFEETSGRHLLVMELVEGEDLAARLSRGPIPLDEALALARQIAEALEAAHEKGIVHRDLKPANVKVTPDGRAKLLDFGLAKALEADPAASSAPSATRSPTLTAGATAAGAILGTAAYMSPEQARGRPVDRRTDVWAFGCVVYEMLAGKRAFEGETVSDTLVSVLTREPDWAALPAETPPGVARVLRRCLQRDAKLRLHDVADARLLIEDAGSVGGDGTASPVAAGRPSRRMLLAAALVAIPFAAACLLGWMRLRDTGPRAASAIRGQILLSPDELVDAIGAAVVVSPDGTRLAYVTGGARGRLWLRPLGRLQPVEVPESSGAVGPFFSPDGRWIAFFAGGKLRKAPVSGGVPVTVCDAPMPRGGAWVSEETIVLAPRTVGGLVVVSASGGEPRILTKVDVSARERSQRWPSPLPGGKAVLFSTQLSGSDYDDGVIEAVELSTGKRTVVHRGGAFPRWSPSGHLLFARKGTIYAAPFDAGKLALTGRPVPVFEGVLSSTGAEAPSDGSAQFDISTSGACVYRTGEPETLFTLAIVDRKGTVLRKAGAPRGFSWARFSPDGTRVAVQISGPNQSDIWIYDVARDTFSKLTFDGDNAGAAWSPDGRDVAFGSDRDRELVAAPGGSAQILRGIYLKRADGSGAARPLFRLAGLPIPTGFSPDGRTLAFQVSRAETQMDVGVVHLKGGVADGAPDFVVAGPSNESAAVFSPDGRWLAYESNDGGLGYVFVRSASGGDSKWQVSDQMGSSPRWSRDGTLYFVLRDASVVATRVTAEGGTPVFGKDERLFTLSSFEAGSRIVSGWDVSPDGQRFITLLRQGAGNSPEANHVTLVSDFVDELRRLAPAGGAN